MAKINNVMKALSDKSRREILVLLRKKGPLNAGEISSEFSLSNATVSHHLALLMEAELISSNKQGKYIYFEINTSVVEEVLEWIYTLTERE